MTLGEYVHHRNGVPLGAPGSMRKMLARSLGAESFAGFWRHWNPVWGFVLGSYVYAPMRRLVPAGPAAVATFAVSGALHDVAASLVVGSAVFIVTPWFALLGVATVSGRAVGMDLSARPWWLRVLANVAHLALTLALVLAIRSFFAGDR